MVFFNEFTYKPSSVIDDHLSGKAVANLLKPLFTVHRANVLPYSVLLRIRFTGLLRLRKAGELLPRLSTLTANKCGGISLLHFP